MPESKGKVYVAETVTVWTFKGKNYILAYNREVNQIWDCNENNVGNSFIDLGIQKQQLQYIRKVAISSTLPMK